MNLPSSHAFPVTTMNGGSATIPQNGGVGLIEVEYEKEEDEQRNDRVERTRWGGIPDFRAPQVFLPQKSRYPRVPSIWSGVRFGANDRSWNPQVVVCCLFNKRMIYLFNQHASSFLLLLTPTTSRSIGWFRGPSPIGEQLRL